jgi:hypothetical protein
MNPDESMSSRFRRHCEARSGEAIQLFSLLWQSWIASLSLAMTETKARAST